MAPIFIEWLFYTGFTVFLKALSEKKNQKGQLLPRSDLNIFIEWLFYTGFTVFLKDLSEKKTKRAVLT